MVKSKPWILIGHSLRNHVRVMLLYVLESSGSSPGRQGFFMAVTAEGEMEGSIGGGIMEHKFVEMAKKNLESGDLSRESGARSREPGVGSRESKSSVRKQVHDKSAARNQSGMICSGEQTILLYEVKGTDLSTIKRIITSLEKDQNGTLILSPDGIQFDDAAPGSDFEYSFQSEDEWMYKEKTGYKNQLSIIGGGHCALALSKLMASMDFYIRVYDERENLNTMVENSAAHEKHFISGYTALCDLVSAGDSHYVVVMTFGYRTDDIAVRALVGKRFKYFGLLGSKSKIEKMFEEYRKEGIKEDWLNQIHSPIGLAIRSQTPEEIAISIAAEIIKVKNQDV